MRKGHDDMISEHTALCIESFCAGSADWEDKSIATLHYELSRAFPECRFIVEMGQGDFFLLKCICANDIGYFKCSMKDRTDIKYIGSERS